MKRYFAALLAALAFASPVLAEDCSKIADRDARLACFDKQAAQPVAEKAAAGKATALDTSSRRCQGITKKGAQCKRNAQPGRNYCYQH